MLKKIAAFWVNQNIKIKFISTLVHEIHKPDSLDIIIAIRDRSTYQLENCLDSIAKQNCFCPVKIILVDYGSSQSKINAYKELLNSYDGKLLQYRNPTKNWNKSKCLNLGICHTNAKYLMVVDADMILQPNFLNYSVSVLHQSPFSLINTRVYDMQQNDIISFDNPEKRYTRRKNGNRQTMTCFNLTWTLAYKLLGGFNENFDIWGGEDDDAYVRFLKLGLKPVNIADKAIVLHQWHESNILNRPDFDEILKKNTEILASSIFIKQDFLDNFKMDNF